MPPKRGRPGFGPHRGQPNVYIPPHNRGQAQMRSGRTMPPRPVQRTKFFKLQVRGYNPQSSAPTIQKYLLRNSQAPVQIRGCHFNHGRLILEFQTRAEMLNIKRLHGFTMPDGFKLQISEVRDSMKDSRITNRIFQYVGQAYDASSKFLDLSNLVNHPTMQKDDRSLADFNNQQFMQILSNALKTKAKGIQSLSVSNNNIRTLVYFPILATVAPGLEKLDLRDNLIRRTSELDHLSSLNLTTLLFTGNPLQNSIDELSYFANAKAQLPTLLHLDGKEYASAVNRQQHTLPPMKENCADSQENLQNIEEFVGLFFATYDRNRQQLAFLYDDRATFSLTCDFTQTSQQDPSLKPYQKVSRNLSSVKDLSKRRQTLFIGPAAIISQFNALPPSQHDRRTIDFSLVSIPLINQGVISQVSVANLRVDGVFEEGHGKHLRYFSRNLVLAEGSEAQMQQGSPYSIVSDHLHVYNLFIKPYRPGTQQQTQQVQPQTNVILSPEQVVEAGDPENAVEMIRQVYQSTNMIPFYCRDLLFNNGWDMVQASADYEQKRSTQSIPPQCYMP
ncbi:putative Nuclear RNA export factor 1 [Blattamonas nauphoetae]|uniref:Nuclear RNA export factor 1 n=1 Tax=Blattamonas nauphoetae TaxID=2049346 RepID=A0ABQ9YML7_9EUKA|nr:putative Nuclear RNA export factor 1 [Blattamonas nauphoetae]